MVLTNLTSPRNPIDHLRVASLYQQHQQTEINYYYGYKSSDVLIPDPVLRQQSFYTHYQTLLLQQSGIIFTNRATIPSPSSYLVLSPTKKNSRTMHPYHLAPSKGSSLCSRLCCPLYKLFMQPVQEKSHFS